MLGSVDSLFRYPVKSLVGEQLTSVLVDERGLERDRLWAVRDPDGKLGSGKSSKRFRRMDGLLDLVARDDEGTPVVQFPDGRRLRADSDEVDAALTAHVGRPVSIAREHGVSHFDDGPVHLVTTSTVQQLQRQRGEPVDVRHFRPNIVLATGGGGFVEEGWIGRRLAIGGDLVLEISAPMPRCVMVTMRSTEVAEDHELLRLVTDVNEGNVGVVAQVVRPGHVAVGDAARLA